MSGQAVNIGIEGMMLSSHHGLPVSALVAQAMGPPDPSPFSGLTVPSRSGPRGHRLHARLDPHAWPRSRSSRPDHQWTIINILALGLTAYLNRLIISPNPRLGAASCILWSCLTSGRLP
jgi:hypothetical protein